MEANLEEALKAKEIAEKRFAEKDFTGAKNYAAKAKYLYPGLDGIAQMVATFDVYIASEIKFSGLVDYYSLLGLKPFADKDAVKKQYKKMAVLLHPDKNKTVGADGAFKLVSEAWTVLSDSIRKSSYDQKRNIHNYSNSSASHGLDTFWTVCTSCKVRYEYLRKYVNKRLSCKNCRGTFIAMETGIAPINGSFPFFTYSHTSHNGYNSHGYDSVTYGTSNGNHFAGNGVYGFNSGHGYEYSSNVSFQLTSYNGNVHIAGSKVNKTQTNKKREMENSKVAVGCNGASGSKGSRPLKKCRILEKKGKLCNQNPSVQLETKIPSPTEIPTKISQSAPPIDFRKMLIDKAKTEIRKKLYEMNLASSKVVQPSVSTRHLKSGSVSISVPDSDFHDFDKDRSEQCFAPKQIWALYDEDDGMPRLYCLIREIVSVSPFKIHVTYLNSKTDTEFGGSVNWLGSGFTKSCGNFRAWNSDVFEQVNIFSHLLKGRKAGRGGCIHIYPQTGEIWAVYRNWSPTWDRSTADDVRHQYEMVEVLDDCSEELGVSVAPLVKLANHKTVYQSNTNKDSIRWIPRQEMLRFSHQVPSCLLDHKISDLPNKCWDLDPAATPDELLHAEPTT